MRHFTLITLLGSSMALGACATNPMALASLETPSALDASRDAADLSTDTATDEDLHRRACGLAYQTYDPKTDTFMSRPGVRERCTL